MAGNASLLESLLEVVQTIHIETTVDDVTFPSPGNGFYIAIMSPVINGSDGLAENKHILKACQFAICGPNHTIATGQTYVIRSNGNSDYWGVRCVYVDTTTKDQINLYIGANKEVKIPGGHDLIILRAKGD